jgi:hypothetical protein
MMSVILAEASARDIAKALTLKTIAAAAIRIFFISAIPSFKFLS